MGVRFLQLWKDRPTDFPDRQTRLQLSAVMNRKHPMKVISKVQLLINPTKYDRIIGPISTSLTHLLSEN